MKLNKEDLLQALSNLDRARGTVSEDDRRLLTLAAVAKGIAYAIPLPGQRVESIRQYYVSNCEPLVTMALSDVNELRVLNVRLALDFTFQIYRARYAVAYDPRAVDLHKLVDSLVKNDASRSLEPTWAGIFERLAAGGAVESNFDYVARRLTDLLSDSLEPTNE